MKEIELSIENGANVTIISNSFIENYMADANGAFVKVYLYLLYLVQKNKAFSIVSACDFLGDTEKDVMRAISYWEKVGLISVKRSEKTILSLILNQPSELDENKEIAHFLVKSSKEQEKKKEASESLFFASSFSNRCSCDSECEDNLGLIIGVAEKYMERCFSPADYNLICDLYERMNFPSDLIIYLFEYCAGIGKTDTKYIEKVALRWADDGIHTVEEAMESTAKYNTNFNAVIKAFGLSRSLGDAETQFVNKWLTSYKMPLEVIIEACGRALIYTGKPDFKYADAILKKWSDENCHNLEAIQKTDALYSSSKEAELSKKIEKEGRSPRTTSSFPQRSYSEKAFEDLEKKLLKN